MLPSSTIRCSFEFRNVFGHAPPQELGYGGVPITRGVHDNHYCSANPFFIAVVTECCGGGAFLVIPIHHTGRLDPKHPRVLGHAGPVLDVKWNPFDDHCVASCSEDTTVKIWDVPVCGIQHNLFKARKTLVGHTRRVGLIEWHPTAENILLSSAYDYKVLLWDVSQEGSVLTLPLRVVLRPLLQRFPSEALLLSTSFSSDGSQLAISSKDRRVRVLDPQTGRILQVSGSKWQRANKVLFLGDLKLLVSTGTSRWNQRQVALWDPNDLSKPLYQEELDELAGVIFPFYDPDTCLLYLAGKGDGNIRYYHLSPEEPRLSFLEEFRSPLPQKGLGVMPKRGLDTAACEVFRFYRLIVVKDLVEPLSMIVLRMEVSKIPLLLNTHAPHRKRQSLPFSPQSEVSQEEVESTIARKWAEPMDSNQAEVIDLRQTELQEWLQGTDGGSMLMSPLSGIANPYLEIPTEASLGQANPCLVQKGPAKWHFLEEVEGQELSFLEEQLAYQDAKYPQAPSDLSEWQSDGTYHCTPHCHQPAKNPQHQPNKNKLLQDQMREQSGLRHGCNHGNQTETQHQHSG